MSALPIPPLPPEHRQTLRFPRRRRWRRVAAWIGAGVLLLFLLVVVAVVVLLKSRSVHGYVLRTAQEKASAALNTRVQLRDFALHFSGISPTLDLYDVAVSGAAPYLNPPLLQAQRVEVRVRVVSLLHRKWYLEDVKVDRPIVRAFVDRNGANNLPKTKNSNSQSHTSVFDLGVRHARLEAGEVYYNNRKSALSADLHDLNFQSAFDVGQSRYSGTMSYRNGHLQVGTFNPLVHNLDARFDVTPTKFTLDRALLTSGVSQVDLMATIEDFSQPRVQARYSAAVDAGEFRRITKNPSLPLGILRLAGSMQYQSEPNRPVLETLKADGDLSSRVLQVVTPSLRIDIRNIGAHYTLDKGNAEVRDIRANLLGGQFNGNMTMLDIAGASRSHLQAVLRGVSLANLKAVMNSPSLQRVAVGGTVNADADARWGKTTADLVATSNAMINASIGPASVAAVGPNAGGAAKPMPVNGVIHARYAAPSKQISLSQSYVRTPQTSLSMNGTVSNRSSLLIHLLSNDLHELETVADMFRTPTPGHPAQALGLYGTAAFNGAVRGSSSAPQITGQLNATNLRVKGSTWRLLRTNVSVSPAMASLTNGELDPATRGRITFDVNAGLRHFAFSQDSPIQVALNVSQVNVADLTKVAGSQAPVEGTLSANIAMHGSELNPVGQGSIKLTSAKIANEPVQSVNLDFRGTGDQVLANLAMHLPAGAVQGVFTLFPKRREYVAQLRADGIRLDQLQAVKSRDMQLVGVLNLDANGRGALSNPQLTATVQVPKLQVRNQTINGVKLRADLANHLANVAVDSQMLSTYLRGRAQLNLTNYYADAALDTSPIPFQPLLAMYAPSQAANITGQTELHATLRGPLKNKSLLEAHVTIPTLAMNYKNTVQIGAASPIHADYVNGVLSLQRAVIRGTGTELQFQGRIPMNSSAPASLLVLGNIDLRVAQLISPDITSGGQVRFNVDSYGVRSDPNIQGQIQIVNATFASGGMPIGLENGNGVLTLTKDRLSITQFHGTIGGGTVTAAGGVVYKPSLQFDMAVSGRGIRMLYPDGMREGFDTDLRLVGSPQNAVVNGQVNLDQLSFTPDFDLSDFIGQFSSNTQSPPPQGITQNIQLDVDARSTTGINLVSKTLSLEGSANLHVQGTVAQPVVLGRVNLSGGDLIYAKKRLILQGGTIDFVNPVQTQPVVNLTLNTTVQQYNIHMQFQGPIDHLRTNYTSDPALPPADIINLLAFGGTAEASSANPTPNSVMAESAIASQVTGTVTSKLSKVAGISQLSLDPTLGGNGTDQKPGARVTIQQRVTGNIFVTFSTDVTSTQNQVIQLEYRTRKLSFSGTRDQNGGVGFDTRIHKSW
ncbi:MAG TPA: translocation/assembly module TamB domain-containing protein [Terriglobales bacterium]|nr:translocation/assembly module TamB domain-containing protein [Terriglobales bacterium]